MSATFVANDYTITVSEVEHGTVEVDPTTAHVGDLITLTVTPDEGYELATVTVTGEDGTITTTQTDDGYTFEMPAGSVTVSATFTAIDYTISVNPVENGTVAASASTAHVGDQITLTVTPDAGYSVGQVTVTTEGGESVTVADNAFTMPAANVTVSATFVANDYTITVSEVEHGTVEVDPTTAHVGDLITLTVTPDEGYELATVTVTGEDGTITTTQTDDGYTFEMPAGSVTVSATFTAIDYTISVNPVENGTVEASATTAHVGDLITLTITPDEDYEVDEVSVVTVNREVVPVNDDYQFTMPASNVLVTVTFTEIVHTNIVDVNSESGVKRVRYFNVSGAQSLEPFEGVNIVVKELQNGKTIVTKEIVK